MIMDLSHCGLFNKHLDCFLKLVYFPVHPDFIDILSFELQCRPSNAPEKVEEGMITVNPRFRRQRRQTPSRLNPELVFLVSPPHMHPHLMAGRRWGRQGEGCLYLLLLCSSVFLCQFFTADHSTQQALPHIFPCLPSHRPSLGLNVPSISSRSPVICLI